MEIVYAGVVLIVVIIIFYAIGEKRVKQNTKKAKKFLTWMNIDMLTSLGGFIFCSYVWLYFNIDNGNVIALQKGWEMLARLSVTGDIAPPGIAALRLAAAIPSMIEWWLLQFAPKRSPRYIIGWSIIGCDIFITAAGYWLSMGLTLDISKWTTLHIVAAIFFFVIASVVNAYIELVGHDCLARFWLTLRGKKAKGDLNKNDKNEGTRGKAPRTSNSNGSTNSPTTITVTS